MARIKFRLRRKTSKIGIEPKQERDRTKSFTILKSIYDCPQNTSCDEVLAVFNGCTEHLTAFT